MFPRALRIARIRGVDVRLDPTLVVFVVLMVWSFVARYGTAGRSGVAVTVMAAAASLGFLLSLLAHELGHAFEARHRHLAVHGITLFLFGGVTEMDMHTRRPRDEFTVAAIGPYTSLVLAAAFGLVTAALDWYLPGHAIEIAIVTGTLGWLNLGLAVFNLVPGAPLDGGRVLRAGLWRLTGDRYRSQLTASRAGQLVAVAVWFVGGWAVVWGPGGGVVTALVFGLVGLFMFHAARSEGSQALTLRLVHGHTAGLFATTEPCAVDADTPLDRIGVEAASMAGEQGYAVMEHGRIIGTVTTGDLPAAARPAPDAPSGRSRLLRTGALLASLVLVAAAALLVPMPLVEAAPGGVTQIPPLIDVRAPTTDLTGQAGLLTVRVDQPSMAETVRAWIDDDRTLRRRNEVVPGMLDHRSYVILQQGEFRRSFRVAAAVGLRAAGHDVGIRTAPQVAGVHPGGPADGHLRLGDVILAFNGQPVASADELARLARTSSVGDELVLRVRRHGTPTEVTVRADRVPGLEHPGMGITLQTLEEDIDLPVEVELVDQRDIGGPSAGLMVALTVYDLVAEEDLIDGRHVVGTGTVDGTGTVGTIGSIREKTLTAVASGAELMLVPASQAAAARDVARGRIDVVGVATMTDAVEALRR